jgi:pimeloyl-ACP methyl ester carboxylesterase/class 3 adenylate cyclase
VPSETRYARSGDVSIAYRVAGDGPFDLVRVPGWVSDVELSWETPPFDEILPRLASFSRLIVFDKRGTGMSDRVSGAPTLETRMDDLRAVMDGAGSARAAVLGLSEGAPMSLLFAATYPERTTALVLIGGFARSRWAPDYPWGKTEEQERAEREIFQGLFRSREDAEAAVRTIGNYTGDEVGLLADYYRRSASPGALEALRLMNSEIDVRHVLPAIRVPTLIIHGTGDTIAPIGGARYMADRIAGARLVEIPGGRQSMAGSELDRPLNAIELFLREVWDSGGWDDPGPDRVLATILCTDIVGSTQRAFEVGDRAWQELLQRHHELVRRQLARFRGREINTAGDGFLASFDGPARAIRCACAIVEGVQALGIEVRAGLHTGECELDGGRVAGIAVHMGARVAAEAGAGEVLVSSTVKDLVAGSELSFRDRGVHELKGVPGEWRLFAVEQV